MKLSILLDNNTIIDQYFLGEPGFSAWVEIDGQKILFDTGYSDAFLKNAKKMGIDPIENDVVVLSHGHIDHTWGLIPLARLYAEHDFKMNAKAEERHKAALITHPDSLLSKTFDPGPREAGNLLSVQSLENLFTLQLSTDPVWITENLLFLGEVPRKTAFEKPVQLGHTPNGPDFLMEDSALAAKVGDSLVIITGCSHAGICNIVQYAQEITGIHKIRDIVGGFHLLNPSDERLNGTVDFLSNLDLDVLHACHCTDLRSKVALGSVLNLKEIGSGSVLEYV